MKFEHTDMKRKPASLIAPLFASLIAPRAAVAAPGDKRPSRPLLTRLASIALCMGLSAPGQVQAQSPFAAAMTVNGKTVTYYEIEQRIRFLEVLRAPGDLREQALQALEDERLQQAAADRFGLTLSEEQIADGMAEFAKRANLDTEGFVKAIAQDGVSRETFRDFVAAGLAWRIIVQGRFGARAQVSEAEVDRALTLLTGRGGARVLLAEIILPARTPEEREASQDLAEDLAEQITTTGAFAEAARRFSVSGSAERGGRMPWVPLTNLPPALVPALLTLAPGEVSDPVPIPNAIALFQVRSLEELDIVAPDVVALEFATLVVGAGRQGDSARSAMQIAERADTCDDLYGIVKKDQLDGLAREVLPVREVPSDIALELAQLDPNETSMTARADGTTRLVMLCGRTTELAEGRREEVRASLINQRLKSYAEGYLEDLRADAIITRE